MCTISCYDTFYIQTSIVVILRTHRKNSVMSETFITQLNWRMHLPDVMSILHFIWVMLHKLAGTLFRPFIVS